MRTLTAALVLLLVLSGCSPLQTIRVVDSQTGKPIEGVQVERLHAKVEASEIPLVLFDSLSPVEKQVTDGSGVATFQEAGNKAMLNPDSKNPEYGKAYVTASWFGTKIRYPDDYREISAKPVGGVLEVPLPRRRLEAVAEHHRVIGTDDSDSKDLVRHRIAGSATLRWPAQQIVRTRTRSPASLSRRNKASASSRGPPARRRPPSDRAIGRGWPGRVAAILGNDIAGQADRRRLQRRVDHAEQAANRRRSPR